MGYFGLMYNMPSKEDNAFIIFMAPSILNIVTLPLYPYLQVSSRAWLHFNSFKTLTSRQGLAERP